MESLIRIPQGLLSPPPEARDGLVVGVDGGATKTLAAVWDPRSSQIWTGRAGPSNPDAVGTEASVAAIHAALREAFTDAGASASDAVSAVLAVAGTDTEAIAARLDSREVGAHVNAVNDVVAAWAAGTTCRPGVAVIAGTGSNVLGVAEDGDVWRSGGWGHILGDEGSAYWLGLEGIKAALHVRDGTGLDTALFAESARHFKVAKPEDVANLVYAQPLTKGEIASFSRVVADLAHDGDEVALMLLRRAGSDLAHQALTVIDRAGLGQSPEIIVAQVGSTWHAGPALSETFREIVARSFANTSFHTVEPPPVYGSLLLAGRAAGAWTTAPPAALAQLLEQTPADVA